MAAPIRSTKDQLQRSGSVTHGRKKSSASKKAAGKARAGKKVAGPRGSARRELARRVCLELLKLRPIIKEVGTAVLDRLDGELAGLAHSMESGSLAGDSPVLPKAPVLSSMLADIKALKVKPKKGRVKDLGRIDALLESLHTRIPPGA